MIFMTMVALLTVSRSFEDISLTSVALPLERVAARVCQRRGYVMFACSEWMTITGTTCCRHHFGFSMQAQPCTRNATVFAHRSGRLCEVSRASRTTIPLGLLVMTLLFHWRPHCTVFFFLAHYFATSTSAVPVQLQATGLWRARSRGFSPSAHRRGPHADQASPRPARRPGAARAASPRRRAEPRPRAYRTIARP